MKRISIFGVTGSIGANTVSVVESIGVEHFKTVAVSGNANITGLVEAAKRLTLKLPSPLMRTGWRICALLWQAAASKRLQEPMRWSKQPAVRLTG